MGEPTALVVFGASGDLTNRKLLPAVAALHERGLLADGVTVVGVARTELSDDDFRRRAMEAPESSLPGWSERVARFRYVAGDYADPSTYERLEHVLADLDRDGGTAGNRVHYLATVPAAFPVVAHALADRGLNRPGPGGSFCRLVVEKPYGHDLASAGALDEEVHAAFAEHDVFRIDHYLGKETVQNLLALRFANAIFEPVWNRRYVDHVQLTVAEEVGVGHRAGFYETAGAMRDIVQNHLLQVLALVAMEPPATFDQGGIRDEKVKLLKAVDVLTPDEAVSETVRGQYGPGTMDGAAVAGYHDEEGVAPDSVTETYVAMRLAVDNWRWAGVPFYARTGKRLPVRATEVVMQFNEVPHLPFRASQARGLGPNQLVLRIQPHEGISLCFGAKVPGQAFQVRSVAMDFSYAESFAEEPPEAYERLLLDAITGDATLFIRSDEVEQAWRICEPVMEAFAQGAVPLSSYGAGTWGPAEADRLLARDGRRWRNPQG